MLIQHRAVQLETGEILLVKEQVSQVEMGSIRYPNNIVYMEYIGEKK